MNWNKHYIRYLVWSILIILSLSTCANNGSEQPTAQETANTIDSLTFETILFEKKSSSCQQDTVRCATLRAIYPLAKGGDPSIRQKINDTLFYYVAESMTGNSTMASNLEDIANDFFQDFEEMTAGMDNYSNSWVLETEGKVRHINGQYVSFELLTYSETGGAHPDSYTALLNFDRRTGETVTLENLIRDIPELEKMVEREFRTFHSLRSRADLNEEGFFYDQDFFLPANFAVVEEGLFFYYNSYEAAPYAVGPTFFTIEFEKLEEILK